MYFRFSGEGHTDLGLCAMAAAHCQGSDYLPGPLAIMVSQIVEDSQGYSIIECEQCGFTPEEELVRKAEKIKSSKKPPRLPGRKRAKETHYFFVNARALAQIAKSMSAEKSDDVVAILFRDTDGTASAGRGNWDDKWKSMIDGFVEEEFERGVPMIPKPKSEAWLLNALKYPNGDSLEERSGNDKSPNSLKLELEQFLGTVNKRIDLCQLVENRKIDYNKINLPSFIQFKERLEKVI